MLSIQRKLFEEIHIRHGGETLILKVTRIGGRKVSLGFGGSQEFNIARAEIDNQPLPTQGTTDAQNPAPPNGEPHCIHGFVYCDICHEADQEARQRRHDNRPADQPEQAE